MGVRILATSVIEFFAGALIPIPFFPQWLQPFIYALPFAPFLIYTGFLSGWEAVKSIGLQLVWFFALFALGQLLIKHAIKKVVVQGG